MQFKIVGSNGLEGSRGRGEKYEYSSISTIHPYTDKYRHVFEPRVRRSKGKTGYTHNRPNLRPIPDNIGHRHGQTEGFRTFKVKREGVL